MKTAMLILAAIVAAPFIVRVVGGIYGWDCDANRASGEGAAK